MPQIADLFRIQERYLRSAHLERDFRDPACLTGYVLTPHASAAIQRLASGLEPNSTQRAWRITGDYGCGKSSFALTLAHLFGTHTRAIPLQLRAALESGRISLREPRLLPVLVTASHQPLALSLLKSLHQALSTLTRRSRILGKVQAQLEAATASIDAGDVIQLIEESGAYLRTSGKGTGLLLLIDELGKFLEYAALNPDRQDAYVLQNLAEAASRSGETPLLVVGLLHQGFTAYADQLAQSKQLEWEKVAGRFDELLFNHPLEQTAYLIAAALNIQPGLLDGEWAGYARSQMAATYDLGWYGASSNRQALLQSAAGCYPLHPTVTPVMVHLFRRFGQNERSLFSFLISNEPLALQDFARRSAAPDAIYRIHHLYDYARGSFGHRLSVQSYRSHWNHIDSVIQSFPTEDECSLRILKTVGLLNMLDSQSLLPSEEALNLAVATDERDAEVVRAQIRTLHRTHGVLYFRGRAGGYCLWPHTSVNLEKAYDEASRALGAEDQVFTLVQEYLDTRPLVARRHYIETGNLRHFDVRYITCEELATIVGQQDLGADGQVAVVLCATEEERRRARKLAAAPYPRERSELLIAVPRPLRSLAKLVQEYQRWQWVADHTPELSQDPYAAEEVSRQVTACRQALENRILHFVGVHQFTGTTELEWFHRGQPIPLQNGRVLLERLSQICDQVYGDAPRFQNELVNRRALSSAASAARLRLIDRILRFSSAPLLGMDSSHKPPEMSMYLSVLRNSMIHQEVAGRWQLTEPNACDDRCNVGPALRQIRRILEQRQEPRVRVSHIFDVLRRAPYGVRDGMLPVLLSVFTAIHEHEVAYYENGNFLVQVTGDDFMRLIKDPHSFEVQYCRLAGVRSVVYERILSLLEIPYTKGAPFELLSVVRPLCTFAARLPPYARQTRRLSGYALAVRAALLTTQEPPTLLFRALPEACETAAFDTRDEVDAGRIQTFIVTLKTALDELRAAYPRLLERIRETLLRAFETEQTCEELRVSLREQATNVLASISEPQLKAFCLRLTDTQLAEAEWLESIGSLVCARPPARWSDGDEELYHHDVYQLCRRFRRVESLAFADTEPTYRTNAHRLLITRWDGTEVERVIRVRPNEEAEMARLETRFIEVLRQARGPGLAAAARAIWTVLADMEESPQ